MAAAVALEALLSLMCKASHKIITNMHVLMPDIKFHAQLRPHCLDWHKVCSCRFDPPGDHVKVK